VHIAKAIRGSGRQGISAPISSASGEVIVGCHDVRLISMTTRKPSRIQELGCVLRNGEAQSV